MSSIKLNSKRAETKAQHTKRLNTLKRAVNTDHSLLRPSTDLSPFGKKLFNTLKTTKGLSNKDNYMLNLLCSEYDLYVKMNDYIIAHGAVDDKGKQSAQYMILKSTINQILKLSSQLNITPKNRISSDYHDQDKHDPVREVFR